MIWQGLEVLCLKPVRPVCCKKFGKHLNYIDFFKFKSIKILNLFRDNYKVKSLN